MSRTSLLPALAAALFMPGCGLFQSVGSATSSPRVTMGTLASRYARATLAHRDAGRSWMSRAASGSALLYVSDAGADDVYAYALPARKLMGKLTGFDQPQGECSDAAGDVFITDTQKSEIVEYAHGGTRPIETLRDRGFYPVGCAIDPTTGSLAVTNIFAISGNYGSVALYKSASGSPVQLTDSDIYYYYFCAYDDRGNLYLDGYNPDSEFAFAELASGGSSFLNISLNQTIEVPGMVQWRGHWIAIGDQQASKIYDFKIRGSGGILEDMTSLGEAEDVVQASIDGNRLYAPDAEAGSVYFYRYPAGGSWIQSIDGFSTPIGTAISK